MSCAKIHLNEQHNNDGARRDMKPRKERTVWCLCNPYHFLKLSHYLSWTKTSLAFFKQRVVV